MCLGMKLSDRSLARYKAKGKKLGYIRVWKCVDVEKTKPQRYMPEWPAQQKYNTLYPAGFSHARRGATNEQELIHAFQNKLSAERWGEGRRVIIEAMVKPEWITAIGENYEGGKREIALTTKAIVMPEYPKRRVTVREFRAAIKGKKVKKYSWERQ